jgi:hypothetical protein
VMLVAVSSGVQTALIAAAASVIAALLTAAAATSAARVRIREVLLTYDQKLHESYLTTARQYTNSVYVPLGIALSKLSASFVTYRDSLDPDDRRDEHSDARDAFIRSVEGFLRETDRLTEQGADAFMTSALEERLVSFVGFLRKSLSAREVTRSVVYESRLAFGLKLASTALSVVSIVGPLAGVAGLALSESRRMKRLREAPIWSPFFERHLIEELAALKALIKEVTLGTQAGPRG